VTLAVAGVDGAKGAWVMAVLAGDVARVELIEDFTQVVSAADQLELRCVGVDMPIAFPDTGSRAADAEARSLLGGRRSTLFPTPVAAVLEAVDYRDACCRSRMVNGKAISKQMWNLLPMVRQVRSAIVDSDPDRFVEAHPESTFVQIAGSPLPSKKTAAGVGRRLAALRPFVSNLDDVLAGAPVGCGIDDVLDALAVACSAQRFVRGDAVVFGEGEGCDNAGHPLQIVA
jgi:predicted RNase H-like nuclease